MIHAGLPIQIKTYSYTAMSIDYCLCLIFCSNIESRVTLKLKRLVTYAHIGYNKWLTEGLISTEDKVCCM